MINRIAFSTNQNSLLCFFLYILNKINRKFQAAEFDLIFFYFSYIFTIRNKREKDNNNRPPQHFQLNNRNSVTDEYKKKIL